MKHLKIEYAVLVYQAGIANVFQVEHISEVSERRGTVTRLMQRDFRTCETFCRGLAANGTEVASMHCNQAGDIAAQTWSEDLDSAPFCEQFRPVGRFILTDRN